MKLKSIKLVPMMIVLGVIGLVCGLRILSLPQFFPNFDIFQRLEWGSYDWRVRQAARLAPEKENRLAFVFISDDSIAAINDDDDLGYHFGLYWPRQVYANMLRELSAEQAKAVALT